MVTGEEKFDELLETLEGDRDKDRKKMIKNRGGFDKVYKKSDIEFPKDGGILAHLPGYDYPMKGAPQHKTVARVGAIKRIILLLLNRGHKYLRKKRTDPHLYCPSVKELYRVCNILIDRERDIPMKERWMKGRDFLCEILQNDLAYRYRWQDIMALLDMAKIMLDEGDEYYCKFPNRNKHYNFGGRIPQEEWDKTTEEREKQKVKG